jgi:hypothetical protein
MTLITLHQGVNAISARCRHDGDPGHDIAAMDQSASMTDESPHMENFYGDTSCPINIYLAGLSSCDF